MRKIIGSFIGFFFLLNLAFAQFSLQPNTPYNPLPTTIVVGSSLSIPFTVTNLSGAGFSGDIIRIRGLPEGITVDPSSPCLISGLPRLSTCQFTLQLQAPAERRSWFTNNVFQFCAINAPTDICASNVSWSMRTISRPAAPTDLKATGYNGLATVVWTAPSDDGGMPITGYTVTSNPAGGVCNVDGDEPAVVCTGLTNGVSYTFTAAATNSVGTGPVSEPSNAVIPSDNNVAPVFASPDHDSFKVNEVNNFTVIAAGSPMPNVVLTAGTLPNGVTFDEDTDSLSGTPTSTTGSPFILTFTASNGINPNATQQFTLTVLPGLPTAPTNVTATGYNAEASVTWMAPANDGGTPITGYTVTSSPAGGVCPVNEDETSVICTGLSNGTSYTFTVVAINSIGTSPESAPSNVIIPSSNNVPPVFVSVDHDSFTLGEHGSFHVIAAGNPMPEVKLTAGILPNGVSFDEATDTLSGTPTSVVGSPFVITFTASNGQSLDGTQVFTLTVLPGHSTAPTAVQATAYDASASVTWTAPVDSGGSPITGYLVTSLPAGGVCPVNGDETSVICTGLSNGTSYTFTVAAINGVGTGPTSVPSNAVIPSSNTVSPVFVSVDNDEFTVGVPNSFVVKAAGSPMPNVVLTAGILPNGVNFDESTDTISGTATVAGTFRVTFTASNGMSPDATQVFTLTVLAILPAAPSNVLATAGNASANLSWSVPASDGGSPITGYTVISAPADGSCAVTGTTAACTGLNNGTSYTFAVSAVNSVGTGPSASSNAVTPTLPATVPTAPNNVLATAGNASANLSWNAPTSDGGSPITGYTVIGTPADGSCSVTGTTAACTGLTNGTSYTFAVSAVNSVGRGPSASSLPVIPIFTEAPSFTSASNTTFVIGQLGSFSVTTQGTPTPTLSCSDCIVANLPTGVTFDTATGVLSGTAENTVGSPFTLHFTATNGIQPDMTQVFTLRVVAAPALTAISPNAGPVSGPHLGNPDLILTGADLSSVTAINFGIATLPSASFTINPEGTQITIPNANIPSGTAGTVQVTLVSPLGSTGSASYTYVSLTGILSFVDQQTGVRPGLTTGKGPSTGDTGFSLTGIFPAAATPIELDFGSTPVALLSIDSATRMTANAPAGAVGAVDVNLYLTSPRTLLGTLPGGYNYTAPKCTVGQNNAAYCQTTLTACIYAADPSITYLINVQGKLVTNSTPGMPQCVDSIPKFEQISIPAGDTASFYCTQPHALLADRTTGNCSARATNNPTLPAGINLTLLDLSYSNAAGGTATDEAVIAPFTSDAFFRVYMVSNPTESYTDAYNQVIRSMQFGAVNPGTDPPVPGYIPQNSSAGFCILNSAQTVLRPTPPGANYCLNSGFYTTPGTSPWTVFSTSANSVNVTVLDAQSSLLNKK
jgi:hypothetical protein